MHQRFIRSIKLDGFLSFAPDNPSFDLEPLNVLIGANGSGKSNFIEVFELLRATSGDIAAVIRQGGGAEEWIWKGEPIAKRAAIDVVVGPGPDRDLRYRLAFGAVNHRLELLDEAIEEVKPPKGKSDVFFYYRFQEGRPVINVRKTRDGSAKGPYVERSLERQSLLPDQSVLAQRKDPDLYPEVTRMGQRFDAIQMFREWSFGPNTILRAPQRADLQTDALLPGAENLGLVLTEIDLTDNGRRLREILQHFLPSFEELKPRIYAGNVQIHFREKGLQTPIPATRLSDGTIRFIALLAILLAPNPPPLICIEEPELGLHPDAVMLLGDLLVEASARTQLIVTTHSDALVSKLGDRPERIVVCERDEGGTRMRRLDADQLKFWLDKYALGDVWRMGEIGGNP